MNIPYEVRTAHARLSSTALEFLTFVQEYPEMFDRSSFAALDERSTMKGWAFQPWPVFGGRNLIEDFERASVGLARLLKSLPARVFANNPRRTAEFYGLQSDLLASLMLEEPSGIPGAPVRGDFIATQQGLKCIELNCGSNVGGWQMSSFERHYRRIPLLERFFAERLEPVCRNSVRALLTHIVTTTLADPAFQGLELNVAIPFARTGVYGFNAQPKEDFQEQYAAVLREIGGLRGELAVCLVTDLKERDGYIHVGDRRIHALFEQQEARTPDPVFRAAKARHLVLFTGPVTQILSDKRNLALLSELAETEVFSDEEREILRAYVPWTRQVRPGETSWRGRATPIADVLLENRNGLVLKHAPSAGGMGVYVGRFTEEKQWAGIVRYALGQSDWVVQEYLPSRPFFFHCDGAEGCPHDIVWGLFAFGEAYGGCSVRMQPAVKQAIVNMSHGATTAILLEVG